MEKQTLELTKKQAYTIWSIISWFQGIQPKPFPHRVMADLYDLTDQSKRTAMDKLYEKAIMRRIVELGKWIERKHPEFIED